MLELLLIVLIASQVFYLLFMVYASYASAVAAGRPIHKLTLVLIGPPVMLGYLLDVVWNCVLGSLLFLEPPWAVGGHPLKWTFTRRLRRHKFSASWRGRQSAFWASLLNPFDPGHV